MFIILAWVVLPHDLPYSIVTEVGFNQQILMDWCGSSMPRTSQYWTMYEQGNIWDKCCLEIVKPQLLTENDTKGLYPPSLSIYLSIQEMEGQFFLFFFIFTKELNIEDIDGKCQIDLIRLCRNKVQIIHSLGCPFGIIAYTLVGTGPPVPARKGL
jgi:hypothetical protein